MIFPSVGVGQELASTDMGSVLFCVEPCEANSRWSSSLEYVYWYPRRQSLPPVLTTSSVASQGILGQPDTHVLYGDGPIELRHDRLIGLRGTFGYRLASDPCYQWEGRAFFLERDSSNYTIKPQSRLLLARPYVRSTDGSPGAEVIAGPLPDGRVLEGGFNAYTRIEVFGQEANLLKELHASEQWQWQGLLGLRFMQMRDRMDLTGTGWLLPLRDTLYSSADHFQTFNKFYGGQIGLRAQWQLGQLDVRGALSAALGGTDQEIRTKGTRISQTPTIKDERPFGLYVLPSNSGQFDRWVLDMVTECNLEVGYQFGSHLRLSMGYTFLHWLNPVRSYRQVDAINTNQILTGQPGNNAPGANHPRIPFRDDFVWLQGFNAGVSLTW